MIHIIEEEDQKIMLLCRVALGGVKMLPEGQDRTADRYAEDPNIDAGWLGMGRTIYTIYPLGI